MSYSPIDPWIATSERIPYLVFPVRLPHTAPASAEVEARLARALPRVPDVFSCIAFQLLDEQHVLFCIRRRELADEFALILYIDQTMSYDDQEGPGPIAALVIGGMKKVNGVLGFSGQAVARIDRLDPPEISRRIA